MSSDVGEVSATAYGVQLAGCGIFLMEQFSGISAVLKHNSQKQHSLHISGEASFCMVAPGVEKIRNYTVYIFIFSKVVISISKTIPRRPYDPLKIAKTGT